MITKTETQTAAFELPQPEVRTSLTKKEAEVVFFLKQGLSNKEIAAKLSIKEKGVKFHLTNVYKKLGVKSRTQLLIKELSPGAPHVG